jgi:hypothetical protein
MNKVPYNTTSENPTDFCENCLDTGLCGDLGPGGAKYNHEYHECDCNPVYRARRLIARNLLLHNSTVKGDK